MSILELEEDDWRYEYTEPESEFYVSWPDRGGHFIHTHRVERTFRKTRIHKISMRVSRDECINCGEEVPDEIKYLARIHAGLQKL